MAATAAGGLRARRALDRRYVTLREGLLVAAARPTGGWVRAIRQALGMSTADLAARLEVAPSTVNRLELSEQAGRIQLDTLTKVAEALGCDVVYALVPRRPLEELVDERARKLAAGELAALGHTMDLEAQELAGDRMAERVVELADDLKRRPGLWRVRGAAKEQE
jgi:predicted DNA-binding mobile mystery protein A